MKTTEPNQSPEPTTMTVTAAASHLPRQPRSRLTQGVRQGKLCNRKKIHAGP